MSNANRDYAIVYDVKNSLLVLSRPLNFYLTDKNTSNIFVKLVTRVIVGDGIDQYTDIENASSYVLTMRVIKPDNEVKSIIATQHESESIFQFDLTEDFKDVPGKYICELTISNIVNGRQEFTTSDPFNYEVKRSILSNVKNIIEGKDTTVEKLLNDLDATKAELTSQIKDKAAIGEVRKNTSIKPINYTEFDTETKQLLTGGAVAVVGEKAVGEENLKDYAVTSSKRTTTGSLAKICSLSNTPIMLDIINKILILPETDLNLVYYNNKFDKLTSGLTIDVTGNGTTCSLYYDTLAKTFKVFETDTLNDNCIFMGTVYWNNANGKYINSNLNCDYVIKKDNKINEKTLVKISSEIVYPEGKGIRIFSQNSLNIDLINKKLVIDKTGYCKVLVDGYLENIKEDEIDISIDDYHVSILYDKTDNRLFASTLIHGGNDITKNNYLLGVIDIKRPYLSTIQCDFKVNGIAYEDTLAPKGKSISIFSQNALNIDLVDKKLNIDKTGYCKILVDGYLVNVLEDEIDISIDAHHVSILYDKENNTLFSSTLINGENATSRNNYLLGVIDIDKPYKSTIQCNFTVDGISYEQYALSLNLNKRWTNKKIGCLGDSITFGAGGTSWVTRLPELTGCKEAINYGISGTCVEENGTGVSFVERYSNMADDLDLICVWGGVNDHHWTGSSGRIFGDINTPSSQINTFYGALKNLCEGLLNKYPTKNIMFITPMKNRGYVAGSITCPAWNEQNGINKTLTDYRNAVIEVCDFYSIPVLDLYSCSGISPENESQVQNLMPDRLHPNTKGNLEILAPKIASFMNNL